MTNTLILKNDGANFEKMYYQAVCMGERRDAETQYARYVKSSSPTFWRDAFRESKLPETVLMSAIINLLDMPFGSYMFARLDDDVIEISPWLYSDEACKRAIIEALEQETADAQTLYTHSRTIHLTANFLAWLERHYKFEEAAHGSV